MDFKIYLHCLFQREFGREEEYVCFVWHIEPEANYTIVYYYICISNCGLYRNIVYIVSSSSKQS